MSAPPASLSIFLTCALVAACGARSAIDDADAVGGGEATRSGSPTSGKTSSVSTASSAPTTTSSSSGVTSRCPLFSVDDPRIAIEDPGGAIFPELGLLPNGNALLTRAGLAGLELFGDELAAFGAWPPSIPPSPTVLAVPVDTYALGPGPDGPVAYMPQPFGGQLATRLWPSVELADVPISSNAQALMVAGIAGRYFYGSHSFEMMDFGSYEPGGLPQVEDPLTCVRPAFATTVPSGQGFLAALGRPSPPEPACSTQVTPPARTITIVRHDHAPGGPDMATTLNDVMSTDEPLVNLALAPASFGGWVVFQTDGSLSRVQPGLRAFPILTSGQRKTPDDVVVVTQDGLGVTEIAVASLGDALVVASIEAIDPGAPTIALQLIMPDGVLGARAIIPTAMAWWTGRIRLLASPAADALLVAWEGGLGTPAIGLARVSCVEGLK